MQKLFHLKFFAGVVFAGCNWDNNNGGTNRQSERYGHSNTPVVKDSIRRMDQPNLRINQEVRKAKNDSD